MSCRKTSNLGSLRGPDIILAAGKKIVQANNLVPFGEEPFAEVRTNKAGAAGDKYPHVLLTLFE